jgi:CrcB protein
MASNSQLAILKIDLIFLAVGAILGAYLRYKIASSEFYIAGIPLAVLSVNVIGSFVLGMSMAGAQRYHLSDSYVLFLGVGFCGSFTTMSSFAYETISLADAGEMLVAFLNVIFNVGLSLLGIIAGRALLLAL